MKVKFWGVRGSIPVPGVSTIRVGGNTPCVEILTPEKEIIVLDAGTGIHQLGRSLGDRTGLKIHLFFSHTHWDHIQGFPFFRPVFRAGNEVSLYGRPGVNASLEETLAGQMQYQYFPIQISDLEAQIRFVEVQEGEIQVNGSTCVFIKEFEHPGGVLSYRIARKGRSVVYATDVEHGAADNQKKLIRFADSADLLVMDCQFSKGEYETRRKGWGHSTPEAAVQIALAAGVRRMAMFHYDPSGTDDALEEIEKRVQKDFPGGFLSREGMELDL